MLDSEQDNKGAGTAHSDDCTRGRAAELETGDELKVWDVPRGLT